DGKIIAAGDAGGSPDFAMARYNSDGSLDTTTFGGMTGKVTTDFGVMGDTISNDSAKFVGVLSNNKIVLAGSVQRFNSLTNNLGIARYNTDGSLDGTFGTGGKVVTHLGTNPNAVCGGMMPGMPVNNALLPQTGALQSDGKILIAGSINTSGLNDSDMFVARFQNTSIDCTLACPANITQPNDNNMCGANVT